MEKRCHCRYRRLVTELQNVRFPQALYQNVSGVGTYVSQFFCRHSAFTRVDMASPQKLRTVFSFEQVWL